MASALPPSLPGPHFVPPCLNASVPRVSLAIETSGRLGSIATVEDGRVLIEEQFPPQFKHAAGIISVIDRLTKSHGWSPSDVNEVYVSAGPGSFTGLRVGITVAKTLAFALGAKLVAVPSTQVLAHNAPQGWQNAIIVLDAKRSQIFTARYTKENGQPVEAEPAHLDTLPNILARAPRLVHLIGDGLPYHRASIPPDDPSVIITEESTWRPRATIVAQIGWQLARAGQFTDADKLTPLYIRRPEAEEKWEQLRR
jgi:tRNA threonylcarbamoyladenosine biosynthesis protein TsaB